MTNRYMVSVAALALLAGTGFANAQGTSKEPGGATGGGTMQHSAPGGTSAAPSATQDSVKGGSTRDRAEDRRPNERSQTTTGQAGGGTKMEGREGRTGANATEKMNRPNERSQTTGQAGGTRMEGREGRTTEKMNRPNERSQTTGQAGGTRMEGREGRTGPNATEMNRPNERTQTTGQAGAGAKLTSDQRSRITTVFRNERVAPENNVNFSVAVGSRVPRGGVRLRPLPSQVVTIYPEWRGYEFIRVRDQIVVVDPSTYEIVAVLEA